MEGSKEGFCPTLDATLSNAGCMNAVKPMGTYKKARSGGSQSKHNRSDIHVSNNRSRSKVGNKRRRSSNVHSHSELEVNNGWKRA